MSDADSPAEVFKRSTAATVRAIAERGDVQITYGADPASASGTRVKLPTPGREISHAEAAQYRGAADAVALRLRYHDEAVHHRRMPAGETARAVYDAVEQARVEALGARRMVGVANNLTAMLDERYRRQGYERMTERSDVTLAEAVRLLTREQLTGEAPPRAARKVVDSWRPYLESRIGKDIADLGRNAGNQEAYGRVARRLIQDLDLGDGEDSENSDESEGEGDEAENSEGQTEGGESSAAGAEASLEGGTPEGSEDGEDAGGEEAEGEMMPGTGDDDPSKPGRPGMLPRNAAGGSDQEFYKAFTTSCDETVEAEELCDPDELTRLRHLLDQQLAHLQSVIARLANRLQRRLMAKQTRAWEFDLDEGVLDAARLSRIVTNPTFPLSYKVEKETNFRDTVVSLLIDNSGSMRGRPITVAAMSADILARTLERCGVKVEILGFTTRAWKGAAGAAQPRPHAARGHPQGEHRRRGAAMGAWKADGAARAAPHPDGHLGRRPGRRFDAIGQPRQLPRAPSARGHHRDRALLAGRADGDRHRPRRYALLPPRRHHRRRRAARRHGHGEARRALRRGAAPGAHRAGSGAPTHRLSAGISSPAGRGYRRRRGPSTSRAWPGGARPGA